MDKIPSPVWDGIVRDACLVIGAELQSSTTPITKSEALGSGTLCGSGTYISTDVGTVLVTCEHVVRDGTGCLLAHNPETDQQYIQCKDFHVEPLPFDVAVMPYGGPMSHDRRGIPFTRICDVFSPDYFELLFFQGFPGTTAEYNEPVTELRLRRTWFGYVESERLSMLTQVSREGDSPSDPLHHELLLFPGYGKNAETSSPKILPNPVGLSGSLVWDTRLVATARSGAKWTPGQARVCGLLWGADCTAGRLYMTKAEHLRSAIERACALIQQQKLIG